MRRTLILLALSFGGLASGGPVAAQDTREAQLRELVRRTAADLRSSQDREAAAQAALLREKQNTAALQKQLDELAAHPVKPSVPEAEITKMRQDLNDFQVQVAKLTDDLSQARDALRKAEDFARAKDASEHAAVARATESDRQAGICAQANNRLSAIATDILHLYETRHFRSLLIGSWEPLLGLKKVELENAIQDYEDKIADQKYIPARAASK